MSSEITSSVEVISPQKARELLASIPTEGLLQRPVEKKRVTLYANAMARGEWKLNGDSITISKTGRLINGQHRMLAVIESDKPISFLVVKGVSDEDIITIDQGRSRSTSDILAMHGYKNTIPLAGCTRLVMTYEKRGSFETGSHTTFTNPESLAFIESNPGIVHSTNYAVGRHINFIPKSLLAACHYILREYDSDHANVFFAGLTAGVGLSEESPALVLRNKLINIKLENLSRKRAFSRNDLGAFVFKAWNASREGRVITSKSLSFGKKETFPVPV